MVCAREEFLQLPKALRLTCGHVRDIEIEQNAFQELGSRECWIQDNAGFHAVRRQAMQSAVDERGFAGTGIAGKDHDALPFEDGKCEARQRFTVFGRQEKERRIWREVERKLL